MIAVVVIVAVDVDVGWRRWDGDSGLTGAVCAARAVSWCVQGLIP